MNALETTTTAEQAAGVAVGTLFLIFGLAWAALILVAGWKMYAKAGQPGWLALIPILNVLGLLKIVKRPLWWFFLFLVPFVNIVVLIIVFIDLAASFGRGGGMAVLLVLLTPIAYLVLGFGSSEYVLEKEPLFT